MRYLFFCVCPLLLFGNVDQEEALSLNRISDFWEEGEYEITRHQIQEFLTLYPNSPSCDMLRSAIADLYLKDKNYSESLICYEKITDPQVSERIFPHKLQCLYALKMYDKVTDLCENFLIDHEDLQITYYLAISLYQQCLTASEKEPWIERASPYFEKLFFSPLKGQVAAPFAHLLCLQKNFPKAADIYLENGSEESLFQAALIQAEYDKELSLSTFEKIKNSNPDYAYNCLVLSFDLQKYSEIIDHKIDIIQTVPLAKIPMAHLFIGRSYFALEQYSEAIVEIEEYVSKQSSASENLHSALLTLLDCSIHLKDLASIENHLTRLSSYYPQDEALFKGKFSQAILLRDSHHFERAKQILESLPQTPETLLELSFVCSQRGDWAQARNYALLVLSSQNDHPIAKNYFLQSTVALANASVEGKKQLVEDFKTLSDPNLSYLLAKTCFNLQEYEEAIPRLLESLETNADKSEDIYLMLALSYRDGFQDLQNFCMYGEKAPSLEMHSALFNAYLDLRETEKAVHHLYTVFKGNGEISSLNLFWLAEQLFKQSRLQDACLVIESIPEKTAEARLLLGKIYHQEQRDEEALTLLEGISDSDESTFLLGQIYLKLERIEEAKNSFAKVTSGLRTYLGASACLQNIRLQEPSEHVFNQYKNLILQKNISNEPLYLEASLDYINLQTELHGKDPYKRIALLKKMKKDFENEEDLLSKDYHLARLQNEKQDAIYQSYMNFVDAEILKTQSLIEQNEEEQKGLQAKANDLLTRIIEEKSHPAIVSRANQCLNP